ncbi:hypothetical protein MTR_0149s0050 [Medicago truncatula]|uniref:Uncharacterized protein n=1 Tax=Medicago truncatula TaxID=3880 RepID=A0A072TH62_MEDTR|nr:hypothetical protein MTR_0149s0050 [Medicago truncatula]
MRSHFLLCATLMTSNLHNPITTESYQPTKSQLKQDNSIDQFFERQKIIDKGVYEEFAAILKREMRYASDSTFMFGLPSNSTNDDK